MQGQDMDRFVMIVRESDTAHEALTAALVAYELAETLRASRMPRHSDERSDATLRVTRTRQLLNALGRVEHERPSERAMRQSEPARPFARVLRDRGEVLEASVGVPGEMQVVCVKSRRGSVGWTPVYGVKPGGERLDLPPCFELNEASLKALDEVTT